MQKKHSVWGAGPKIVSSTLVYLSLVLLIDNHLLPVAVQKKLLTLYLLSTILLTLGIFIWFIAARTIFIIYKRDTLYRDGLYKYCRHPLYANFIFILTPGFCLLANSWLILTTPVFMYFSFRYFIKEEEQQLITQFGAVYIQYKKEVNCVIPKFY